jgi:hypothetical protein
MDGILNHALVLWRGDGRNGDFDVLSARYGALAALEAKGITRKDAEAIV